MVFKTRKREFDHFSALASEWQSKNGRFKVLHQINSIRLKYIQNTIKKEKLNKFSILDIGCGGGLVSEGLSRLGAEVTGLDFVRDNINYAKLSAKQKKLKIKYKVKDFENEDINYKYDIIIIFEVLEHLNDWEQFIKKIKKNLKKGGIIIISTINKNLLSKFLTIDLAENYLKWIPEKTHNYHKFIKPNDLEYSLSKNNFKNINFHGLVFNPLNQKWKLSTNTNINYFCSGVLN
tara:strand:- start:3301 stop:4002 length:702 start_codon:yes stop_codon:yes gene_type:complete